MSRGCASVPLVLLLAITTVFSDPIRKYESSVVSKCSNSKFGCCPDKKTAASGPFDAGCQKPIRTCNETEYFCCPDGVSPAEGPDFEGCPVPSCRGTLYGCCSSDNKTAAEGNDQEGCPPPTPACLSSQYGCCKDGETKATDPNNAGCPESNTSTIAPTVIENNCTEGCGPVSSCYTSTHGCCADGKTPAHGLDQEGCCLMTTFGCCPDNYRPADGLILEECVCQYAHFGCCPDNMTIARGANKEGCGCQYTEHGCCPDRHTKAYGPHLEGCDCHTYQFGCCPDGVTVATGPNLQGCHCSTSKYGCCGDGETPAGGPDQKECDCSTSMYGCCPDGETSAEGTEFYGCSYLPKNKQAVCSLAPESGPCLNLSVYWYYDIVDGCSSFQYGGCEGNGNRFETKQECEDICVQPLGRDVCKLPKIKGAYVVNTTRWYYDSEREQCLQFDYGGHLGNANNFDTKELCEKKCEPELDGNQCTLPIEKGPCEGTFGRWGFNSETGRCDQFFWGGCEGNSNRFNSETACMMRCKPTETPKSRCTLPQVAGNCTDTQAMWSFSLKDNQCVPFYYNGCMGNDNSFTTFKDCTEACPSAYEPNECTLPPVTGECSNYKEMWYYNTITKTCSTFYYGGCGGNGNNFNTKEECERRCFEPETPDVEENETDICQMPVLSGPCNSSQTQWFYNATTDSCNQFTYGGCEGNDNRFETHVDCEKRCKVGPIDATSSPDTTTSNTTVAERTKGCQVSPALEQCAGAGEVWYLDPTRSECVSHVNSETGATCRTTGVFYSQEACERSCGFFELNNDCKLAPVLGVCKSRHAMWYYDITRHECQQFNYSGCGGNNNRFVTSNDCMSYCRPDDVEVTTIIATTIPSINTNSTPITSTPSSIITPSTTVFDDGLPRICHISPTLEQCVDAGEVWYLDPTSNDCVAHNNSDTGVTCRTTGVFYSQEACERSCGVLIDIDVCIYTMDPGPCDNFVPKYYFDSKSDDCKLFHYGGCLPGPNMFSTVDECIHVCKPYIDPCKQYPEADTCNSSTTNSSSTSAPSSSSPSSSTLSSSNTSSIAPSSSTTSPSTPSYNTTISSTLSSDMARSNTPSSNTTSSSTESYSIPSSSTPSLDITSSSTPSFNTTSSTTATWDITSSHTPSSNTTSSSTPSFNTTSSRTPSSNTTSSSTSSSNTTSSSNLSSNTTSSSNLSLSTTSSSTSSSNTTSSSNLSFSTTSSNTTSSSTQRSDITSTSIPSLDITSSSTPSSNTTRSSNPSFNTTSSSNASSSTTSSDITSSGTPSANTTSTSTSSSNTTSSSNASSSTTSSDITSSGTPSSNTTSTSNPSFSDASSSSPSSDINSSSTPSSTAPSSTAPSSNTPTFTAPSSSSPNSTAPSSTAPSSLASTTTVTTRAPSSPTFVALKPGCQPTYRLEKCEGAGIVWYLNPTRNECVSHINSDTGATCRTTGVFDSQEACERTCGVFSDIDVCRYAMEPGKCRNFVYKYYFDEKSDSCKVFTYGGCQGGPNMFSTLNECVQVCKPYVDPCKQYPAAGNCKSSYNMWYYNKTKDQCDQFNYTGCGGNNNRFATRNDCMSFCKTDAEVVTTTTSPTIASTTSSSIPIKSNTSSSTPSSTASSFIAPSSIAPTSTASSSTAPNSTAPKSTDPRSTVPSSTAPSSTAPNSTAPSSTTPSSTAPYSTAQSFTTPSSSAPNSTASSSTAPSPTTPRSTAPSSTAPYTTAPNSTTPSSTAPSSSAPNLTAPSSTAPNLTTPRFTTPSSTAPNSTAPSSTAPSSNAPSSTTPSSVASTTTITTGIPSSHTTVDALPEDCQASPALEQCAGAGEVWYLDPTRSECVSHINSDTGATCRTTGVFYSQEACERSCGVFSDINEIDLCQFGMDHGEGQNFVAKYYFEWDVGRCKKFAYGGSHGGPNMFSTFSECMQVCSPYIDTCKLKYLEGQCLSRFVMWFYDENRGQCGQFIYSGCGGNSNRFKTLEECEGRCKHYS